MRYFIIHKVIQNYKSTFTLVSCECTNTYIHDIHRQGSNL